MKAEKAKMADNLRPCPAQRKIGRPLGSFKDVDTAKSYSEAGLPWFDYYQDGVEALPGGNAPAELKSVYQISQTKGDMHSRRRSRPFFHPPTFAN